MSRKPSQATTKGTATVPDHLGSAAQALRPGWHPPDHSELPQPTYWPAVLALGITFLAWGLVTSLVISGVGLILLALALAGWIGELRHGH